MSGKWIHNTWLRLVHLVEIKTVAFVDLLIMRNPVLLANNDRKITDSTRMILRDRAWRSGLVCDEATAPPRTTRMRIVFPVVNQLSAILALADNQLEVAVPSV